MLKTTHKHFLSLFAMLQWISVSEAPIVDPWPLNWFWGVLLSSLFLSLIHYCPRLTAFTSSEGFIWLLCQLRQIGPAVTTQYEMSESTLKITLTVVMVSVIVFSPS